MKGKKNTYTETFPPAFRLFLRLGFVSKIYFEKAFSRLPKNNECLKIWLKSSSPFGRTKSVRYNLTFLRRHNRIFRRHNSRVTFGPFLREKIFTKIEKSIRSKKIKNKRKKPVKSSNSSNDSHNSQSTNCNSNSLPSRPFSERNNKT